MKMGAHIFEITFWVAQDDTWTSERTNEQTFEAERKSEWVIDYTLRMMFVSNRDEKGTTSAPKRVSKIAERLAQT